MHAIYKTTLTINERPVILEYHEPRSDFDTTQITNVLLLAFDDEGKILAIGKRNALDIPSGHMEWDDDTFLDTARRIAYEELGVELGEVMPSTLIISRNGENPDSPISYMPVVTAQVKLVRPFVPTKTIKRRVFCDREGMLKKWRIGKPEDMVKLLDMAMPILVQLKLGCQLRSGKRA